MEIQFTTEIFKEGEAFVAHTPELDISSCAESEGKALENLKEAVRLFMEEADRMGTLNQILEEAGFSKRGETLRSPPIISTQRVSLPLPLLHVREA